MKEAESNEVIPAEDFRAAIDACCRVPWMNRRYQEAPTGARLYVALQFYAQVNAGSLDEEKYQACLSEIEPDLTLADVDYLLATERDERSAAYLRNFRAFLAASMPGAATPAVMEISRPARAHFALKKVADVRREQAAREEAEQVAAGARAANAAPSKPLLSRGAVKVLAALAVLLLAAAGGLTAWRSFAAKEAERRAEAVRTATAEEEAEQVRIVEAKIAELEAEKNRLTERHEKALADQARRQAERMDALKKEQAELQAVVDGRREALDRLEAQARKLAKDAEEVIAQLEAKIKSRSADALAMQGRAGQVVDKGCPQCRGAGQIANSRTCPTCLGDGKGPWRRYGHTRSNCSNCRGSGRVTVKSTCPACSGRGRIPLSK